MSLDSEQKHTNSVNVRGKRDMCSISTRLPLRERWSRPGGKMEGLKFVSRFDALSVFRFLGQSETSTSTVFNDMVTLEVASGRRQGGGDSAGRESLKLFKLGNMVSRLSLEVAFKVNRLHVIDVRPEGSSESKTKGVALVNIERSVIDFGKARRT